MGPKNANTNIFYTVVSFSAVLGAKIEFFLGGFIGNQPKSWQWKQKQWKPKKRPSLAKNGSKVPNGVTTLIPYKSGLEWT